MAATKVSVILDILQTAMTALTVIPATSVEGAAGSYLLKIIQSGMKAYEMETGKPVDLTLIPQETLAP